MQTLTALTLICPQSSTAQSVPAPPANALILFGARWCAPCSAELGGLDRMLDRLATLPTGKASEPRPQLVLAWIDRAPPLAAIKHAVQTAHAPARVVIQLPATASVWAEPHLAAVHGLPFSAITDEKGQVCLLHQGPLQASMISALWSACHQGQ